MLHPPGVCLCCGLARSASFTMHKTHSLWVCLPIAFLSHAYHAGSPTETHAWYSRHVPVLWASQVGQLHHSQDPFTVRVCLPTAFLSHAYHAGSITWAVMSEIMTTVTHELLWVRSWQQLHSSAAYAMWRGTGNISNLNSNCWGEEHLKSKHQISGNRIIYVKCNVGLDNKVENDSQKEKEKKAQVSNNN